ncbi:hypothetical protein N5D61_03675 [Pseudomonas sp. GD03842]|uniref:hypothetical protein n=1 Tax=unclassified Pseudomonas TaxID=196821 RepID=UPI000D340B8C|nr:MULTISPECIES: hypothetical protein [unclassified Pseudomonas]MDH0745445.1 hypothetical protein [Pseudomonas sp. GD03842]RAU45171.1 hypothetical protein DBP26_014705 [Pseudomonas sp. RIT 409]RAU51379.1 hypothetical protein DBY65_020005 [Pseudomonas sp. RIT 412]
MEPIDELTQSLTSLLESIAGSRHDLDIHGQKTLLEALRQLLKATEELNLRMQDIVRQQHQAQRSRPALRLVK